MTNCVLTAQQHGDAFPFDQPQGVRRREARHHHRGHTKDARAEVRGPQSEPERGRHEAHEHVVAIEACRVCRELVEIEPAVLELSNTLRQARRSATSSSPGRDRPAQARAPGAAQIASDVVEPPTTHPSSSTTRRASGVGMHARAASAGFRDIQLRCARRSRNRRRGVLPSRCVISRAPARFPIPTAVMPASSHAMRTTWIAGPSGITHRRVPRRGNPRRTNSDARCPRGRDTATTSCGATR